MEVDSRMHAASFLPTYPPHTFEPLTLSTRDFFPPNPTAHSYMPATAHTAAAKGFWVQLGAFQQVLGAVELQRQVEREIDALRPLLAIFNDERAVHRLQAGPFRTRAEAQGAAAQVRELMKLVPVIVERR